MFDGIMRRTIDQPESEHLAWKPGAHLIHSVHLYKEMRALRLPGVSNPGL